MVKAGRGSEQFMMRMPDGMRDRISREAAANGRSMNAEIIARLEKSFEDDKTLGELWGRVDQLETMVHAHDEQLSPAKHRRD